MGEWIQASGGEVPGGAVRGGQDKDGSTIYIGRAWNDGDLLPAKVVPTLGWAYVSYDGQEIKKFEYEVLCYTGVAWKSCSNGAVPQEAVRVGHTASGEPLYVGRALVDGTLTIGKVHPSHGVLYIPYDNQELKFQEYEVLIIE